VPLKALFGSSTGLGAGAHSLNMVRIIFALSLIILSTLLYLLDYLKFGDSEHILDFLLQDFAFLLIQVLLVTLILDWLLGYMDKRNRLKKLDVVIRSFFMEIGTKLLTYISDLDPNWRRGSNLVVEEDWSDKIRPGQQ